MRLLNGKTETAPCGCSGHYLGFPAALLWYIKLAIDCWEQKYTCPEHDPYGVIAMDCRDCREDTSDESYMVHDDLWKQSGMKDGNLCIGCLEKRLGRQLNGADFQRVPVNTVQSGRLADRLTKGLP